MAKGSLLLRGDFEDPYKLEGPSVGLNDALNGGLMAGRLHILWGPKASGKTTYAMHCLAEAQRLGKNCVYVDAEKTYSRSWAEACGVDTKKLGVLRANSAETILKELQEPIMKGEIDFFIIDSLSSIWIDSYTDKTDSNPIGVGARSSNFLVGKLLDALQLETMGIIIAHMTMTQGGGQGMFAAPKISKSVEHWASTIIKFQKSGSKDDVREDGAFLVKWKVEKSKQSKYPADGQYFLKVEQDEDGASIDFDNYTELVEIAKARDVIEGTVWLNFGDFKAQGKNKFANALRDDPELYKALKEATFNA